MLSFSSGSVQGQMQREEHFQSSLVPHRDDLAQGMAEVYQKVDQRIGNIEELLRKHTHRLQDGQFTLFGMSYGPALPDPRPMAVARRPTQHETKVKSSSEVGLRVAQYAACAPGCSCHCHKQKRAMTPNIVNRIFGQLFLGYVGLPLVSARCNVKACEKKQNAAINVEYWFPLGNLWSTIIRLQLTYQANVGPHFGLKTLRSVPDSAQSVNLALTVNIEGLRDLFTRGLASPRDVSITRGYSVLRWAMYGQQYQTCRFLFNAGADPHYRPIAASDNSPCNKAHQQLLMGGLSDLDVEALRSLTSGDEDFIDEQNYTTLHKIILGLSMASLDEEICLHPELINVRDAMNRTPLAWAACRGDDRAIVMLLSYGAEVNTLDVQNSAPVCHAADRNFACVQILLEASADPNIARNHGLKVGDGLNTASRNAFDPLILKLLLDFGAYVESCGVDGMTPLIHAARRDMVSFVVILLENGANVNTINTAGQTPLTVAVAYNSHDVLRLLLDRWSEYSECPCLKGPHLLQIVALHADLETISILRDTDHLRLRYDASYVLGDFANRLAQRPDVTEKLLLAFDKLLKVIREGSPPPYSHHDELDVMEAGMVAVDDHDDERDVFENALESLHLEAGGEEGQKKHTWKMIAECAYHQT